MERYNLRLPADKHGGQRPALEMKDRPEFVKDVRGEGDTQPLTRAEIVGKWGARGIRERSVDRYIGWAKSLVPMTEEEAAAYDAEEAAAGAKG